MSTLRRNMIGFGALLLLAASGHADAQTPAPVRFYADLSAAEQSVTTVSPGVGRADFALDRDTLRLSWKVTYSKLTSGPIGAGVHGPQRPGTNAGVQIDFGRAGGALPLQGSAALTDAQIEYLLAGRMYVNVRTARYPEGELRGQVQRVPAPVPSAAEVLAAAKGRSDGPRGAVAGAPGSATVPPARVSAPASARAGKTTSLAFVVANFDTAVYETPLMDECPDGPAIGNDELWWRGLSRERKDTLTGGGLVQPVDRRFASVMRGPKGEDVCWNPTIVQDPPLRTVKGKVSYGFDLDGSDADDAATPKSCPHENFVSDRGAPGVDNQLYRLLGCHYGWRRNGVLDTFGNEERRNSGRGVVLIEVTGVTDPRNSPEVEVAFYRAIDPFPIDAAGRILPYASYRIDMNGGKPRYGTVVKGRIENGVLKTRAVDAKLPYYGNSAYAELDLRDMQLELELTPGPDGKVRGLLGGYWDFDKWWEYMLKIEFLIATGDWSCPALYTAAKQLADGYPDPKSGECTAISSAFRLDALPAFVIHEPAATVTRR
jgi:hypothetical protein